MSHPRGWTRTRWFLVVLVLVLIPTTVFFLKKDQQWGPYVQPDVDGPVAPEFSLGVVGDFGIGNAAEDAVAKAMKGWSDSRGFDAFVSAGDNFYPEAEEKFFYDDWTKPYGWVDDLGIPLVVAIGNHDVEDGSPQPTIDFFDLPGAWYSRSVGPIDFFVLDSNRPTDPDQLAWAKEAIPASHAAWKIVIVHKPPYDCARDDGNIAVRDGYVSLFEDGGVDLVISGHEHNYQRFAALNDVTYIITGGGGDSLYGVADRCAPGTPARVAANDTDNHFLAIEGTSDGLVGWVVTPEGAIIDRFELEPRSAR